jgi:ribose transport system substrate-binding protein
VKKKHYIAMITPVILLLLLVTLYIYYNINNALASIDNSAGRIIPGKEPEYHFAMICENVEDSTWQSVKKGVERASEDFNVAVEINWPANSGSGEQAKHMDMAIASKVDGILTYVWDEEQAGKMIDTAVEQNIPVVTIGIDAKNSKREAFVGMNSYSYGQQLAKMLLGAAGDKGDAVVLVSNSQVGGTVVQNLIISGLKDALKNYPNLQVTTIEYNQSDVLGIEDTIKDILTNRPGLDAIVCTSARDTALVAQRLIDLNKVGYSIIGYGDTPEILRYIDNGVVYGTVMASHEEMGYNAVKALYDIKTTGRASAYFTVNTSLITKTNVSEYLKQGEE